MLPNKELLMTKHGFLIICATVQQLCELFFYKKRSHKMVQSQLWNLDIILYIQYFLTARKKT